MSDTPSVDAQQQELAELKQRVQQLEADIRERQSSQSAQWPPQNFYADYYAYSGAVLGGVAAMVSLLANVIGAPVAGKSALELIRIYLTFPDGREGFTTQFRCGRAHPDARLLPLHRDGHGTWRSSLLAPDADLRHNLVLGQAVGRSRPFWQSAFGSSVIIQSSRGSSPCCWGGIGSPIRAFYRHGSPPALTCYSVG